MMFLCLLGPVCLFDQCFDMLELYIIDVVLYFNVFQIHFTGAAGVLGRGPRVGNSVWFLFASQGPAKLVWQLVESNRHSDINYCKVNLILQNQSENWTKCISYLDDLRMPAEPLKTLWGQ